MKILLTLALLFCSPLAFAAPVCMYQDNLSGPATGGEGGGGTYVDVYGTGFGSSIGAITGTVNGTAITNFINLSSDATSDRQVVGFQVPSGATGSGSIVINFPGGSCSNMVFTVRSGAIYFIGSGIDNATTGVTNNCTNLKNGTALDGNVGSGTFASPWKVTNVSSTQINGGGSNVAAPANAVLPGTYYACINAGNTIVFLNGFSYPYADAGGLFTALALHDGYAGTSAAPTVLMARPGASALLGGPTVSFGIRDSSDVGFVIAGLTIRAQGSSVSFTEPSSGPFMRLVGNDLSAPTGAGSSANVNGGQEAQVNVGTFILGNYSHGTSCSDSGGISNKQYHSFYLQGNQIEFGWNKVAGDCTYNAFQWNYFTDTSLGFGNGKVHDNDLEGVNGSGINIPTWDSAQGPLSIYNNIIHHVGLSTASDGDGGHFCISFPGEAPSAVGTGTAQVYNNTMGDCSSYLNTTSSTSGACMSYGFETAQAPFTINYVNNICYQPAYTFTSTFNPYLLGGSPQAILTGSNNIWFSGGTPGSTAGASALTSKAIPTNPLFVSTTFSGPWTNLALQSGSPAIGAGSASLFPTNDFAGIPFSNPPAIGALMPGVAPPTFLGVSFSIGTGLSIGTGID
jgi:hypothetical protein